MRTTIEPFADFPPKKRSGTRAIAKKLPAVCVAKPGQFHAKCNYKF